MGRGTFGRPGGRTHIEVDWTRLIGNLGMGINNCWAKHQRMPEILQKIKPDSSTCFWMSTVLHACIHTYLHMSTDASILQFIFFLNDGNFQVSLPLNFETLLLTTLQLYLYQGRAQSHAFYLKICNSAQKLLVWKQSQFYHNS